MINPCPVSSGRVVRPRGFTLVELLIVIAIISILLSVLVPAAWNGLKTSRQSAATQSSHGIGQLMTQYALDQGAYPDGTASTDVCKLLITKGYLTSADIFYLPNGGADEVHGRDPGDEPNRAECVMGHDRDDREQRAAGHFGEFAG